MHSNKNGLTRFNKNGLTRFNDAPEAQLRKGVTGFNLHHAVQRPLIHKTHNKQNNTGKTKICRPKLQAHNNKKNTTNKL